MSQRALVALAVLASLTIFAGCERKGSRRDGPGRRGPQAEATPKESAPAASGGPSPSGGSAPGGRPNIVFILTDDQRAESVSCMPKLRKLLLDKGVSFGNSFASTSLCCPARSTLLTGLYAHNHGVLQNGDVEDGEETKTPGALDFRKNGGEAKNLARWLKEAGYRTSFFGKYLNGYDKVMQREGTYTPAYWDDWYAFPHAEYFDFQLVEKAGVRDNTVLVFAGDNGFSWGSRVRGEELPLRGLHARPARHRGSAGESQGRAGRAGPGHEHRFHAHRPGAGRGAGARRDQGGRHEPPASAPAWRVLAPQGRGRRDGDGSPGQAGQAQGPMK